MENNEVMVETTDVENEVQNNPNTISGGKAIGICAGIGAAAAIVTTVVMKFVKKGWNWVKTKAAARKAEKESAVEADEE